MIVKYFNKSLILLSTAAVLSSCVPDSVDGNGINQDPVDASFTTTKTAENRYTLKRNFNNFLNSRWNIDNDGFNNGKNEEKIFLPDAGTYKIQHNAIGIGGAVVGTASQTIVVPTSDPISGNMIQGGRFDTPEELAKWTKHVISPSGAEWILGNGKATIVATDSNQQALYQAVNVVAGKQYSIDMVASSQSALVNTWFEVYVLNNIPASGQDVSGTVYRNINTWDGCGTSKFEGKISSVGCNTSKNGGVYTATTTGTVYLVIKCGGKTVNGLSIDKVEFRRMQ